MSAPLVAAFLVLASRLAPDGGVSVSATDWKHGFDLDGDGRLDEIQSSFSGGAHCCYRLAVRLTSIGRTVALPFEIDGGYASGLDLSRPETFEVRVTKSIAEVILRIATYDGKPMPLPKAWRQKYGITSHRIAVTFPRARMQVRNLPDPR